jgi:putative ABC transport system ATP-binding protein
MHIADHMISEGKGNIIEVDHVGKTYRSRENEYIAVKDISIKVRAGEAVAVLGPSGSGKTTLLDMIGTLDSPTKGRILIDGVDVSTLSDDQLSVIRNEKIGFVFQSYNLVPYLSAVENVLLPVTVKDNGEEHRERAMVLLREVGLGGKAEKKPTELSGGEQQRVAIVRALINKPQILLADEPTGNLDSKTSDEILNLLRRISKENNTTVLVVTHDPELASLFDRRIYIRDGMVEKEIRVKK